MKQATSFAKLTHSHKSYGTLYEFLILIFHVLLSPREDIPFSVLLEPVHLLKETDSEIFLVGRSAFEAVPAVADGRNSVEVAN